MEDRYLFRAKRIDNGEWEYGCLLATDDCDCKIVTSILESTDEPLRVAAYSVDPDTICQCIGKRDVNGELIFEGDIIEEDGGFFGKRVSFIVWGNLVVGFIPCMGINVHQNTLRPVTVKEFEKSKVIGNRFDNFKLIRRYCYEGGKEMPE